MIPGIVLMLFNGILPLIAAISIILKRKYAGWLIAIQGGITLAMASGYYWWSLVS